MCSQYDPLPPHILFLSRDQRVEREEVELLDTEGLRLLHAAFAEADMATLGTSGVS